LVRTLPDAVQQHVQAGQLVPHAAMKYFVPVARANAADCVRLVEAICAPSTDHPTDRPAL
jgi:hypothetical protein